MKNVKTIVITSAICLGITGTAFGYQYSSFQKSQKALEQKVNALNNTRVSSKTAIKPSATTAIQPATTTAATPAPKVEPAKKAVATPKPTPKTTVTPKPAPKVVLSDAEVAEKMYEQCAAFYKNKYNIIFDKRGSGVKLFPNGKDGSGNFFVYCHQENIAGEKFYFIVFKYQNYQLTWAELG